MPVEDNGFGVMHRFIRSQHLSAARFTGGTKAEPWWRERLPRVHLQLVKHFRISQVILCILFFFQGKEVACHVCKKNGAIPKWTNWQAEPEKRTNALYLPNIIQVLKLAATRELCLTIDLGCGHRIATSFKRMVTNSEGWIYSHRIQL